MPSRDRTGSSFSHRFLRWIHHSLLVSVVLVFSTCGGEDGVAPDGDNGGGGNPPGDVSATVRLVSWNDLSGQGIASETPSAAAEVSFRVLAPDLVELATGRVGATRPIIENSFVIDAGPMRRFEATAYDGADAPIYRGVKYASAVEDPTTVTVAMVSVLDTEAPSFAGAGAANAISLEHVQLAWAAASDASGNATGIAYLVYHSTQPGMFDYTRPAYVSPLGTTSLLVSGLAPGTTHYFVVRAMDPAGNVDANTVQAVATTHAQGADIHVDVQAGADTPDCGDVLSPCKTITAGLARAGGGRTVLVAAGTYNESSGETYPLRVPAGSSLIGDGVWRVDGTFRTRVLLEAATTPAISADSATNIVSFAIDAAGTSEHIIDANAGYSSIRHCIIDGTRSPGAAGIKMGDGGEVYFTRISGFTNGRGLWVWGADVVVDNSTIYDCQQGILASGTDIEIKHCLIEANTMGIVSCCSADGLMIFHNTIRDNTGNAIDIQDVPNVEIIYNAIDGNTQHGLVLAGTGATTARVVLNYFVNGGSAAIVVRSGNADIYSNTIVCNPMGLYITGAEQIDARWNRWENNPPTISGGSSPSDPGCTGSVEICYEGQYAGTPEPLYLPTNGTSTCGVAAVLTPPAP